MNEIMKWTKCWKNITKTALEVESFNSPVTGQVNVALVKSFFSQGKQHTRMVLLTVFTKF